MPEENQSKDDKATKMADIEEELRQAFNDAVSGVFVCSVVILALLGAVLMCLSLLKIPEADNYPLVLNHQVLASFIVCTIITILFILFIILMELESYFKHKRKTKKMALLVAEGGLIKSAEQELSDEYCREKQRIGSKTSFAMYSMVGIGYWFCNYIVVVAVGGPFFRKEHTRGSMFIVLALAAFGLGVILLGVMGCVLGPDGGSNGKPVPVKESDPC